MAVGDAYVFPGFLTPVLTQLFFPKPQTTFLICICRGERRKYAGKKSRLNQGLNSQPPGHESDTLSTEPPGRGINMLSANSLNLDHSKILLCCKELTLYHTTQTFKESFCKHSGKRRKMLKTSIFSFSRNVFYPSQDKFQLFSLNLIFHLQMLSILITLKFC